VKPTNATTLEIIQLKWQGIGRERERLLRRLSLDPGILAGALDLAVAEGMAAMVCRWQIAGDGRTAARRVSSERPIFESVSR